VHYDEDDPFVPIWEGPYLDAELIKMRIEEAHIPVEYGDALLPGEARVQVPRSYLAEVKDVISGSAAMWPEISEHGPSGVQVKPTVQLGTRAVALYLAIALFVGSAIVLITLLMR
jgi:hypothetical protein